MTLINCWNCRITTWDSKPTSRSCRASSSTGWALTRTRWPAGKTNLHDALAIALTDQGKNTMEQIGRVLFQMGQDEEYSLGLSQQHAESNAMSSQITSVVLIGAVAMVLMFIIIILLRLEKLQQVVTVCAWTGQVKFEGQWVRLDEYLQRRFGLSVSHGLSREAAEKMAAELKEFNRPGAGPPTAADAIIGLAFQVT